jgi:hypothetical protein
VTKYFYGQVTTAKIADGAVTTPKLADGAATYAKCYDKTQAGSVVTAGGGVITITFAPAFAGVPKLTLALENAAANTWTARITSVTAAGATGVLERNNAGTAAAGTTNNSAAHNHVYAWPVGGGGGFLAGLVQPGPRIQIDAFGGQNDALSIQDGGVHSHTTSADAVALAPVATNGVTVHWLAFYDTP